ncbi:hypothetical protein LS482_04420 [Sinomicrobium kalidii]|uniref:hypothetical protein n=1 Tax=Sinomicrobium kalidii TaxID=2900738 RepID=UPI001E2C486C|nr:hypothetical protein [Sinomicrobium kalidii]UGU17118.1 hypothetical protein LS482_04420 [Sinomicrobium kalidii]
MRLHAIGIGKKELFSLVRELHRIGYAISGSDESIPEARRTVMMEQGWHTGEEGWFPEKITSDLDGVLLAPDIESDNPELLKARETGIKIYSYPELLYHFSRYKTRVVLGGSFAKPGIASVIMHVMDYHDKAVDYMIENNPEEENHVYLTEDNEFILITGGEFPSSAEDPTPGLHWYCPNIALLSGIAADAPETFSGKEDYEALFRVFVDSIVKGGIVVYNEEDGTVKEISETSENPIRKHPYRIPEYEEADGEILLETPEGPMPLEVSDKQILYHLAGAKWICQHMGVDEDDFYEALAVFAI